ncbi:MAG: copper homeostasis protein CutC [Vicinamibacterales bacterium]
MSLLLEVIVQSVEDALAAEAGGADRLEVVRAIERDGLTPPAELVRAIVSASRLPLRVMVRETDSFTVAGAQELTALQRALAAFADIGVDGAVLGFAKGGAPDLQTTTAVLSAAPTLPVTFHRAFDSLGDPLAAIDALQSLPQVDRILTSGGSGDWAARCRRFAQYTARAGSRLTILAGGGVDADGVQMLASTGCVREAHVGRAACEPPRPGAPVAAERVKSLRVLAGQPHRK